MIKILMLSLLISGSAFAQSKGSTIDALNAQLWASDGFELRSKFDPFMDQKMWDKDTNNNQIVYKNTKEIEAHDGEAKINPKNYKIELNYEDVNVKKKQLNSMYSSREWNELSIHFKDQSITKLKNNKIQEVTGCSSSIQHLDTKRNYACATTSKVLCDFIAKRSEKFFHNKSDAMKCGQYISNLLADLSKEQKTLVADLDKTHKANVNELKSRGEEGNYAEEDNGLIGLLKMKPVEFDQANLMASISVYQEACSIFKMNEKESGKTRSLRDEPVIPASTEKD